MKLQEHIWSHGLGNRWPKYKIEQLPVPVPVPVPAPAQESEIEGLVDRVLAGKKAGEDTAGLETEIDLLVRGLYGVKRPDME